MEIGCRRLGRHTQYQWIDFDVIYPFRTVESLKKNTIHDRQPGIVSNPDPPGLGMRPQKPPFVRFRYILGRPGSTALKLVSQATPRSRWERVWSARIHRVVTTPRSWRDQSDQVFCHDVIISREIHVPRARVRLSAVQTRKDIMAASFCKNNDKARDVVRLSPLSVLLLLLLLLLFHTPV